MTNTLSKDNFIIFSSGDITSWMGPKSHLINYVTSSLTKVEDYAQDDPIQSGH